MNFRLSGTKIRQNMLAYPKYLGVLLGEDLLFKDGVNTLKTKTKLSKRILAKLRYDLPFWYPENTIVLHFFNKHLAYVCHVWGQGNSNTLVMVQRAKSKPIRIIKFKKERNPCELLFTDAKY